MDVAGILSELNPEAQHRDTSGNASQSRLDRPDGFGKSTGEVKNSSFLVVHFLNLKTQGRFEPVSKVAECVITPSSGM